MHHKVEMMRLYNAGSRCEALPWNAPISCLHLSARSPNKHYSSHMSYDCGLPIEVWRGKMMEHLKRTSNHTHIQSFTGQTQFSGYPRCTTGRSDTLIKAYFVIMTIRNSTAAVCPNHIWDQNGVNAILSSDLSQNILFHRYSEGFRTRCHLWYLNAVWTCMWVIPQQRKDLTLIWPAVFSSLLCFEHGAMLLKSPTPTILTSLYNCSMLVFVLRHKLQSTKGPLKTRFSTDLSSGCRFYIRHHVPKCLMYKSKQVLLSRQKWKFAKNLQTLKPSKM